MIYQTHILNKSLRCFTKNGKLFGGICGVCWCSHGSADLHDRTHMIAKMDVTKFMFNITNLLMNSPASSNKLLYDILSKVADRMRADFEFHKAKMRLSQLVLKVIMASSPICYVQVFTV